MSKLEKNRVITMINYIFYQAGRPMPAIAAEFFPPDQMQTPLLGGKESKVGFWEKCDPR
jgi:hypothetical protein